MGINFQIEDLRGKGITAVVLDGGRQYTSYYTFANVAGHPDAVLQGTASPVRARDFEGATVDVLAKGVHEANGETIYVCKTEFGGKFLIGPKGVGIFVQKDPTIKSATFEELLAELMLRVKDGNEESQEVEVAKTRKYIVAQAKEDIEGLKGAYKYWYVKDGIAAKVEFVVNTEKRTVVALMRGVSSGAIRFKGIAKCDPADCFNEHIGKAIALRRALGLEVPFEYLNAPKPIGVEAGDIVEYEGRPRRILAPDEKHIVGKTAQLGSRVADYGTVINDSNRK